MQTRLNNNSASINAKIKNLAKAKQVAVSHVLDAFLLERMAYRITTYQNLADFFVFKGGLVSLLVYGSSRFTVDIDAVLKGMPLEKAIADLIVAMERELDDGTWFVYETTSDIKIQGDYEGKQLQFRGGIGSRPKNMIKARKLHIDVGVGDAISPPPRVNKTKMLIDDENLAWQIYSIETIVAEKIHAIVSHGSANSRSKDVYDLSKLLPPCDQTLLKQSLKATFSYRDGKEPPNLVTEFKKLDLTILKRGWTSALVSVASAPSIEECWKIVVDEVLKRSKEP